MATPEYSIVQRGAFPAELATIHWENIRPEFILTLSPETSHAEEVICVLPGYCYTADTKTCTLQVYGDVGEERLVQVEFNQYPEGFITRRDIQVTSVHRAQQDALLGFATLFDNRILYFYYIKEPRERWMIHAIHKGGTA